MWIYRVPDLSGDEYVLSATRTDDDFHPLRVELGNAADLAHAMGINRATAAKLVAAGVAGPIFTSGRGELVLREMIDHLAALEPVSPESVNALVLRVGPAATVDEEFEDNNDPAVRSYSGWNCFNEHNEENIAGVDRWWRIPDAVNRIGHSVVVTVGPVIVGVFALDGYRAVIGNLRWLRLGGAHEDDIAALKNRRLDLPAGPPVVALPRAQPEIESAQLRGTR